jgi:hypothetical protein
MKTATVCLVALLATAAVASGCVNICKKFSETKIPGCSLRGKGCKCILDGPEQPPLASPFHNAVAAAGRRHHGKYDVEMTDPTTGTSARSSVVHSETLAGQMAVYELFAKDLGCNCHTTKDSPVGHCTYPV